MGEWIEVSAKTTEEAVTEALIRLGTTSDHVEYEILEKESKGFFGIGSRAAKIRARIKQKEQKVEEKKSKEPMIAATVQEKPQVEEEKEEKPHTKNEYDMPYHYENKSVQRESQEYRNPYKSSSFHSRDTENETEKKGHETTSHENREPVKIENVEELIKDAEKFLKDVFQTMDLEARITTSFHEPETTMEINLEGGDMGILIGKRGQTLDSLQYLVSLVINRKSNSYVKVKLDTENYRERRRETLENLARNIAFKVKRTKRPVTLEPMNPYERRIIHSALQYDKFVETHSEGEEPYRKIVVTLKRNGRDYGNRRSSYSRDYHNNYRRDYHNYKKARQAEKEAEKKASEK